MSVEVVRNQCYLFCIFVSGGDFFYKQAQSSAVLLSVTFTMRFPANGSQARKILDLPQRLYS